MLNYLYETTLSTLYNLICSPEISHTSQLKHSIKIQVGIVSWKCLLKVNGVHLDLILQSTQWNEQEIWGKTWVANNSF